jgi:hypothetical protein
LRSLSGDDSLLCRQGMAPAPCCVLLARTPLASNTAPQFMTPCQATPEQALLPVLALLPLLPSKLEKSEVLLLALQLLKMSALPASLSLSASWQCCAVYCVIATSLSSACMLPAAGECELLLRDSLLQLMRRAAGACNAAGAAALATSQLLLRLRQEPACACCILLGCALHDAHKGAVLC